jgi:hypothetical protein
MNTPVCGLSIIAELIRLGANRNSFGFTKYIAYLPGVYLMEFEQYQSIEHLGGIEFAKALLDLEQKRFQSAKFRTESTYENINADFGIFPSTPAYPVYFAGDIRFPESKIVIVGLNPGYDPDKYSKELEYLNERGLFEGYCNLYGDYFKNKREAVSYYSNLKGFISRLYQVDMKVIDWDWFQKNLITLELVPYHSVNVDGLRINDSAKFSKIYMQIMVKLLEHINSRNPVFINGFPTVRRLMTNKYGVLPDYNEVLQIDTDDIVATGRLANRFKFIGLPFLSRPRGGKDALVEEIRRVMPGTEWRLD